MLHSMTGFGLGRSVVGDDEVVVELKSVNHKFCEVKTRLPRELVSLESGIVRRLKDRLARGAVDVVVKRSSKGTAGLVPTIDHALAAAYRRAWAELATVSGLPDTTTVRDLAQVPNVLKLEEPVADLAKLTEALDTALEQAVRSLESMRATEGAAIGKDLLARLAIVERSVDELARLAPGSVEEYRARLSARIDELSRGVPVDAQRLAQEVAFFAERSDVAEELTRLRSHFVQFKALCDAPEPAGRKLDFLVQEMHREINTTGSKSASAAISVVVVNVKAELERVREQVQNVE